MWLRALANPLVWVLGAALAAVVMFGLWRDAEGDKAALRGALAAEKASVKVLAARVEREAAAAQEWRGQYDALLEVEDTDTCGPAVRRALGILQGRDNRP